MNNLHNFSQDISPLLGSLAMATSVIFLVIFLVLIVLLLVSMCLIFVKAGRKWWEAIIPVYNVYILTILVGQPWWIMLGFFIPIANWVVGAYLYYHLSKRFGYDIPFTIGLVFLPFIFLPILGFGPATYTPPEEK